MRTIDYDLSDYTKHITSAYLCSQCGVCEMIACDFILLSPKKIYAEYRKLLAKKGIKNPHSKKLEKVNSTYEDRKVSIPMVMKKLGLAKYYQEIPYLGKQEVDQVKIALNKHIGVPAKPIISLGQKVKYGEVIAKSPDDKLGSVYHASISGKVIDVSNEMIEIRK